MPLMSPVAWVEFVMLGLGKAVKIGLNHSD